MAHEGDDERARETDRLFRGLPARGEVFDSIDDIGSMDPPTPNPASARAPSPAPALPAMAPVATAHDEATVPTTAIVTTTAAVSSTEAVPTVPPVTYGEPHGEPAMTATDTANDTADLDDHWAGADPIVVDDEAAVDGPRLGRTMTIVAAVLVAVGAFLIVFPFDVTVGPVTAHCGPPVYEVLVPTDAAFDVPENTLCGPPAQHRLAIGALAVGAFLVIALAHQWSAGSRRRRARRARRHKARAARSAPSAGSRGANARLATGQQGERPSSERTPEPSPEPASR